MINSSVFLLAVDVGTSSLKAVLYDEAGRVLDSSTSRYSYNTPHPNWAEIDPQVWWQALKAALGELPQALLQAVQVIAFTGQMHSAVLLDIEHNPIAPTILWLDRRAAQETAQLQQELGLPPYQLNSTYTLPKLLWQVRNQPETMQRVRHILWPKDYLRFRLTGEICTDRTEAGGAVLLDWDTNEWALKNLERIGLDAGILPPFREPTDSAGPLLPKTAKELGLPLNAKVIVGAGDVLALISGAPPAYGRITCSLGSSSMIFGPIKPNWELPEGEQRIYIYPLLPYRLLGGVSSSTGASLHWAWRTFYGQNVPFDQMIKAALQTAPGADGLIFLPFLTGERSPFWNDAIRGSFYGLTSSHQKQHLVRAVMEGVAYSLRYLLDIYREIGAPVREIALAGGGASTRGWKQIIADVTQAPVHVYTEQETVTRSLYAYACASMEKNNFETALANTFEQAEVVLPNETNSAVYNTLYEIYCSSANFANAELSQMANK